MTLEPERAVMGRLFYDKVIEQARKNREKWGEQNVARLIQVCQVQLGQMADQYLKNGYSDKFKIELVHLGAVLYELYTGPAGVPEHEPT